MFLIYLMFCPFLRVWTNSGLTAGNHFFLILPLGTDPSGLVFHLISSFIVWTSLGILFLLFLDSDLATLYFFLILSNCPIIILLWTSKVSKIFVRLPSALLYWTTCAFRCEKPLKKWLVIFIENHRTYSSRYNFFFFITTTQLYVVI